MVASLDGRLRVSSAARRAHSLASEGLRAACSHCDYSRRFSPELSGRYFRCPKCKQGVLAVPRASVEDQARWRSSEDRWLVAREGDGGPPEGRPAKKDRPKPTGDPSETPTGAVAMARAGEQPSAGRGSRGAAARAPERAPLDATLKDDSVAQESDSAASRRVHAETASSADALESDDSDDHRGQVATVRRILVECGLCGFLVRIPPEFFGKTVHCPECAGDTVFSESTLEPVKDELVDRMALESAERDLLFRLEKERSGRWTTLRSFLVGVGLGLVAILMIWGVLAARRGAYRDAMVEQAVRDGWRWATDDDEPNVLHEPWCRHLGPRVIERISEDQRARRPGMALHDCE